MKDRQSDVHRPKWRLPIYASIAGWAVMLAIAISPPDIFLLLNLFLVVPVLLLISFALPIVLLRRRRIQPLPPFAAVFALWAIAASLFFYDRAHPLALHERAKWLARSGQYKAEVLQQPSSNGDLKHVEWDGFGFAGAENTVYLVFDPQESVSKDSRVLKFRGRSCSVWDISRLEEHWYSVLFYTGQSWDDCK